MTCDKPVRGVAVTVLAPTFGERVLLVPFQHLKAPDIVPIIFIGSVSDERQFTPSSSNWKTYELSLNAHVRSSVVENWMPAAA